MSDTTEAKFTEEQHFALLESAVARETSALATAKTELEAQLVTVTAEKASAETANTDLQSRIDVLEAEKSAAVAATSDVQAAFDEFKTQLAETAEVETRRAERVAAVKEAAAGLAEDYFTDERAQRWAEMSQESFDALLDGLAAVPSSKTEDASDAERAARETSAFKGGMSPTEGTGATSTLGSLFGKLGLVPAGN